MPVVDVSKVKVTKVKPGWNGRFVHSPNMTFVFYDVAEGAPPVHEHQHEQEEVWNVIDGEIEVTIDDVTTIAGPGCVAIVPSNTLHSVRVLRTSRVIVVDHPTRPEFEHRDADAANADSYR